MRRVKFSLRSLFVLLAMVASLLALWRLRPPRHLAIRLAASGTAVVNDGEIAVSSLPDVLSREGTRRTFWFRGPLLLIEADPSSKYDVVADVIEKGRQSGFRKISFATGNN